MTERTKIISFHPNEHSLNPKSPVDLKLCLQDSDTWVKGYIHISVHYVF